MTAAQIRAALDAQIAGKLKGPFLSARRTSASKLLTRRSLRGSQPRSWPKPRRLHDSPQIPLLPLIRLERRRVGHRSFIRSLGDPFLRRSANG